MKHTYLLYIITFITISSFAQTNHTAYQPGQTFKDCKDCPEMVIIPAGSFMMGSPENEKGRTSKSEDGAIEGPQKRVSIRQYAAGKFDITKEQWALFVRETNRVTTGGCEWADLPGDTLQPWELNPSANWNHIGFPQDSSHPVVCISWNDAKDYVDWLSKKTGFIYRLLSKAEWEYAACGGTTTAFPWGDTASHEYANYGMDSGYTALAWGRDQWLGTSPVGSFPPNAFGLYDMNGNIMQWVEGCFSNSYQNLPADGSAHKEETVLKMTGRVSFMNEKSSLVSGNRSITLSLAISVPTYAPISFLNSSLISTSSCISKLKSIK